MYEFLKGDRNKAMIRYKMDVNFFKTSDSEFTQGFFRGISLLNL
jgi:hypothetical protein